jgi:hypothetical protein
MIKKLKDKTFIRNIIFKDLKVHILLIKAHCAIVTVIYPIYIYIVYTTVMQPIFLCGQEKYDRTTKYYNRKKNIGL